MSRFHGIISASLMVAAMMAGLGNVAESPLHARGQIFYPGAFCDFGSGINYGAIEYARRHNRRSKIIRRNRGQ